jgi:hypothetical protein
MRVLLLISIVYLFLHDAHANHQIGETKMIPSGYDKVSQALQRLRGMVPAQKHYTPHLTRTKLACVVDRQLIVHALRCAPNPLDETPTLRNLEYTVLDPNGSEMPTWRTIAHGIFNPAFPVLSFRGEQWIAGVVGTLAESKEALRLRSYHALLFSLEPQGVRLLGSGLERNSAAIRLGIGTTGSIYLLGQQWFPPPVSPKSIALRLAIYRNGASSILADPVPGTDTAGSYPSDSAMHISADESSHIVYDGLQTGVDRGKPHLWYVILDSAGKLQSTSDLGAAPRYPILTRIFSGPDGQLSLLIVYFLKDQQGLLAHKLVPLKGRDSEPGPSEHYFVDYWLQAHAVWFEKGTWYYTGPDGRS